MEYRNIIYNDELVYGKHLMLTAKSCNGRVIQLEELKSFVNLIIKKIHMEKLGPIIVEKVDDKNIYDGYSIVQIIYTSTITMHTYHYPQDFYLDVFSCKEYDEKLIVDLVKEIFDPESINHQIIYRG